MGLVVDGKMIRFGGYALENWSHIDWVNTLLSRNAEMIWGKREQASAPAKSATVLKLVKDQTESGA